MRCTPISGSRKTGYNALYGNFRLPEKSVQALYDDFPEPKFLEIALYADFPLREIGVQRKMWSKRARKKRTTRYTLFSPLRENGVQRVVRHFPALRKEGTTHCTVISRSRNSEKSRCTRISGSRKEAYNDFYPTFPLPKSEVRLYPIKLFPRKYAS